MSCPSDNTQAVDQSSFWNSGNIHWDAHRIGWAIAGGCSAVVSTITLLPKKPPGSYRPRERRPSSSLLSLFSITVGMPRSCVRRSTSELTWPSNYTKPSEQRQMYARALSFVLQSFTGLWGTQNPNIVHASGLCRRFILLLPLLPRLHLLLSCGN